MPRLLAILAAPALLLALAPAAPVPKARAKEPVFPTEVGTKWLYEQNGRDLTEEVTRAEERQGGTRLTVRVASVGTWEDTLDVTKEGVFLRTSGRFKMDKLMLRLPLKVGDSWAVEEPLQPGLRAHAGRMTVGKEEELTVPAGTFLATRVVFEVTVVNGQALAQPETYTYWYAPGVGVVRLAYANGQKILKAFTPARK